MTTENNGQPPPTLSPADTNGARIDRSGAKSPVPKILLNVDVLAAHNTKNVTTLLTQDPYVVVRIHGCNMSQQTLPCHGGSNNPTFTADHNNGITFNVTQHIELLEVVNFELWDSSMIADEMIGSCTAKLSSDMLKSCGEAVSGKRSDKPPSIWKLELPLNSGGSLEVNISFKLGKLPAGHEVNEEHENNNNMFVAMLGSVAGMDTTGSGKLLNKAPIELNSPQVTEQIYTEGSLEIEIVQAKSLRDTQTLTAQNPFCIAYLLPVKMKKMTDDVSGGGTDCTWGDDLKNKMSFELMQFETGTATGVLVEVWSKNTFMANDFIGSCVISLTPANTNCEAQWHTLNTGGEIECSLSHVVVEE
jgi:hypothetical protein